jgi:hypothetical protein
VSRRGTNGAKGQETPNHSLIHGLNFLDRSHRPWESHTVQLRSTGGGIQVLQLFHWQARTTSWGSGHIFLPSGDKAGAEEGAERWWTVREEGEEEERVVETPLCSPSASRLFIDTYKP